MVARRLGFLAVAAAFLLHAGPALASLSDEVAAGKALAAQVESGDATCSRLSDDQFEHLGEYAMDRMVGSRAAHEAMNDRMARALGAGNADRMHELMGRRYAGCTSGNGTGLPMGPAMMGGGGSGMMRSSDWTWMHDGVWQRMSQRDWRNVAGTMMGSRYRPPGDHRWSTTGVVAIVIGAALLSALLALVAVRRPRAAARPPRGSEPRAGVQ